jgi:membrane AbrB-like protein
MGSGLTPESVAQARAWPASLALLAASVAAPMVVGAVYLERVHRWDPATARYALVPGALSAVVVLAATSAADLPRVVLAQSVRIFSLVALMPVILGASSAAPAGGTAAVPAVSTAPEVLATLAASGAAATLFARLRVPAGVLLGAMAASAALHATGLVHGRFPPPLVVLGFVATGAVIGSRFRGTTLATLRTTLPGALGSVLLALTLSTGFTAAGVLLLGLPFGQLWLAYAPGGVEAMAAMALALGLDPAFVGAHHVARIIGLNLVGPLWLRARGGRPEPAAAKDGSVAKSGPAEPDEQHPSPDRTGRPR